MDTVQPTRLECTGTVDRSLPCLHCGYDLRTLAMAGRCPECGMPVEMTVSLGGELARTRPAYARRLALASRMLLYARLGVLTGALLTLCQAYLPRSNLFLLGYVVASLLCLSGPWLLTSRGHPRLPPEMPWLRRAIRATTLLVFLGFVPWMLIGVRHHVNIGNALENWLFRHATATEAAATCAMLLYTIHPSLEMVVMVRLARRVADDGLGKRAVVSGLGATAAGATMALVQLVGWLFPRVDRTFLDYLLTLLALLAMCVPLLCWLWTAWNCLLASRSFAKAGRLAAARWQSWA